MSRQEAVADAAGEPTLATFLHSVILSHSSIEVALAFLLANKLADGVVLGSVQARRPRPHPWHTPGTPCALLAAS